MLSVTIKNVAEDPTQDDSVTNQQQEEGEVCYLDCFNINKITAKFISSLAASVGFYSAFHN